MMIPEVMCRKRQRRAITGRMKGGHTVSEWGVIFLSILIAVTSVSDQTEYKRQVVP